MTTQSTITAAQILSASSFEVMISMADLLKYGSWCFRADYEDQEKYDYSTDSYITPDPEKYDEFVANCNVRVIFRNSRSLYEIREGSTIWAEQWTCDDAASAADIAQAISDGMAEVLEADFE